MINMLGVVMKSIRFFKILIPVCPGLGLALYQDTLKLNLLFE